jgi:hypothetical protein
MSALTTTNGVSKTLANQKTLPKLPVPALEDTLNKYLRALSVSAEQLAVSVVIIAPPVSLEHERTGERALREVKG